MEVNEDVMWLAKKAHEWREKADLYVSYADRLADIITEMNNGSAQKPKIVTLNGEGKTRKDMLVDILSKGPMKWNEIKLIAPMPLSTAYKTLLDKTTFKKSKKTKCWSLK